MWDNLTISLINFIQLQSSPDLLCPDLPGPPIYWASFLPLKFYLKFELNVFSNFFKNFAAIGIYAEKNYVCSGN